MVIARALRRGPRHAPRGGERTNGEMRSRHTNRICLPSTADEDDVAISTILLPDVVIPRRFNTG